MSNRERKEFRMYDQYTPDYDILNSFDSELIEIASPPIKVYSFNLLKTVGDRLSGLDDLYAEPDSIDEERLYQDYKEGFDQDWDPMVINEGEVFDEYVEVPGYYQDADFTQELSRMGIEVKKELAINFNYQEMLSRFGKEIKIGDIVKTFRGDIYRVMDAYVADEIIGWKYIHFHVIGEQVPGLDRIILPDGMNPRSQPGTLNK